MTHSELMRKLCQRINYQFNNVELLQLALSHRSVAGAHNERLEFLGDSVLGFIIAEALYHRFPKGQEGQLSRLRASLVKGETLVKLAQAFELGECLLMGPGELKSGGHRRHSILENAFEAMIGAIYLDSNMDTCRKTVLEWFSSRLDQSSLHDNIRDPKSRLQEYIQGHGHPLPSYTISRTEGPEHVQTFYVRCEIPALELSVEAAGHSRKQAEQCAAELLLQQLKI